MFIMTAILGSGLFVGSCKKDDVSVDDSKADLQSGTWKVTLLEDDGQNETYHFSGYNFTFGSNGVATASNGQQSVTGSWQIQQDSDHVELVLNFGSNEPWDELQDDWHIIKHTATKFELEDVSGDGSVDKLVFEKN